MVAEKLQRKLVDALRQPGSRFTQGTGASAFQRPVLLLMNRSDDLPMMLTHCWTYRPLVHDVLGMHLNKVVLEERSSLEGGKTFWAASNPPPPTAVRKPFDLDVSDTLWASFANRPFQDVGGGA